MSMPAVNQHISKNIDEWLAFAESELNIPITEAKVLWMNHHHIGKFLICEAREDNSTRLFIRTVTDLVHDYFCKSGWWNTFTVTKTPVKKGLWLAQVVNYRIDRNGYINLEVEIIIPVNDIKFHTMFLKTDGTWESDACWLMISQSNAFLDEYKFESISVHNPNVNALMKQFPETAGLPIEEVGKIMLLKYLRNEVTMEEIETCLKQPTEWQALVTDIQKSIAKNMMSAKYGEKYPVLSEKISGNVIKYDSVSYFAIEDYLQRQLYCYEDLLNAQKIKEIDGDVLDKVEAVLQYRKALKDAEKAAKKEKRKSK